MSKGAAYAAVLGGNSDPDLYANYKAEIGKRLPGASNKAHGGAGGAKTGQLSPDEMLDLQRQAKAVGGVDLTLDEIARAGWVDARQLMQDLAEEANDYADDGDGDNETYGEIVRFSDVPV